METVVTGLAKIQNLKANHNGEGLAVLTGELLPV